MIRRREQTGFTIVELLIVIVVIGILASISVVAYNGIQVRSQNTARNSAARQFETILNLHHTLYGEYPALVADTRVTSMKGACLGTGWPERNGGKVCWDIDRPDGTNGPSTFPEDPAVNAALTEQASLPNFPKEPLIIDPAGPGGTYRRAGIILGRNTGVPNGGYPQGYFLAWILEGPDATCAAGAKKSPLYTGGKETKCIFGLRGSVE